MRPQTLKSMGITIEIEWEDRVDSSIDALHTVPPIPLGIDGRRLLRSLFRPKYQVQQRCVDVDASTHPCHWLM